MTVVADPVGEDAESVELSSTWGTSGGVEGEWERAVHAVLDAELFESCSIEDGEARVERSTAVGAMVETLDDVRGEEQADALVAYLESAGVWRVDGSDVVLLQDPRVRSLSGREALVWAVAFDVCIGRLDEVRDAGGGSTTHSTGGANVDTRLTSLREALSLKESEVRVRAIQQREFPEDATPVVGELGALVSEFETLRDRSDDEGSLGEPTTDIASELAGVGKVDEAVENTSGDELAEMVENDLPELDLETDDVEEGRDD